MPAVVVKGAALACSFGAAPAVLSPTPNPAAPTDTQMQVAVVTDSVPNVNIPTFGMCLSIANPAVQSATTAASGVFTPAPCVPATSGPWAPGSASARVFGTPVLLQTAVCNCLWAGVVSVTQPGQIGVNSV